MHRNIFGFFVGTLRQSKVVAVYQGKNPVTRGKKFLGLLNTPSPINKVVLLHQPHHFHFYPTILNAHLSLLPLFRLADDFHLKFRKKYLSTWALDLHKRSSKVLLFSLQCLFMWRLLSLPMQHSIINPFVISVVLSIQVQIKAGLQVLELDYDACLITDGVWCPCFLYRFQHSYNSVAIGVFRQTPVYCCLCKKIMLILITK